MALHVGAETVALGGLLSTRAKVPSGLLRRWPKLLGDTAISTAVDTSVFYLQIAWTL